MRNFICDRQETMCKVVETFLTGKGRKKIFGGFQVKQDKLLYVIALTPKEPNAPKEYHTTTIAIKLPNGSVLGNSNILPMVGRYSAYGEEVLNHSQTTIQQILSKKVTMLPFSVFSEAKLDINEYCLLDKKPEETVKRKGKEQWSNSAQKMFAPTEDVHFTGAQLFKVGKSVWLFDIDRNEIKNKIFNPFLVRISSNKVKTIAEAYEWLKPVEVKRAEKEGKRVLRQGEWFFIPCKAPKVKKLTMQERLMISASRSLWASREIFSKKEQATIDKRGNKLLEKLPKETELKAGNNRPNTVKKGLTLNGVTFVTGLVEHSGREHHPLMLEGWYKVYPNTSTESFQITGDID